MATRSPFARRRSREHPKPLADPEREHPRRRTLMAYCPECDHPFAFEADQMNNGGMYQIDKDADKCPYCKAEAQEVYRLEAEPFRLEAPEEGEQQLIGAEAPSGKVYRRAALSRNTAGMGMDAVAEG